MGVVAMHAKTDSEVTSVDASTPPRSPPRRALYYVQSPSNNEYAEKMSYGSSPAGSPPHHHHHQNHHYYHCSPIHHSRESSTSRFSASLKNPTRPLSAWRMLRHDDGVGDDADGYSSAADRGGSGGHGLRLYLCFALLFVALFSAFSLILWGASKAYKPTLAVKNIVFENMNIQAGNDGTGVPTDMLSLNSTVKILYTNPATFFGVHVTSTPVELYYYQLRVASGHMKKFYQSRKSHRTVITIVMGNQVPLYGGMPFGGGSRDHLHIVAVPLNLTFAVKSKANILGKLVRSRFHRRVRCLVTLRGNKLGKPHNLTNACTYQ